MHGQTAGAGVSKVVLLREKKAGHINQVEGIGEVLGDLMPCEAVRVDVRPRWWAHSVVRQAYLHFVPLERPSTVRRAIRQVYGFDADALSADIVVGSGRPTIALGIWLAHYHKAVHIFSGHAKGPRTETINLQLINNPRLVGSARYAITPVPGVIDGSRYGAPKSVRVIEDLVGTRFGLALGGDSHSHKFTKKDWSDLIAFVRAMRLRFDVRWVVSTSRRSPPQLADLLRDLRAEGVVEHYVDFAERGIGSAGSVFESDVLVVTEDSLSMLSEGLAAGRPVVALRPQRSTHCEMSEVVAYQIGQGWLASVPMVGLDTDTFVRALLALRLPDWTARDIIKGKVAECLSGSKHGLRARSAAQ